jgi:hypothetical protein
VSGLREILEETAVSNDLVPVDVPEWGRKVYIRKMSVGEQIALAENEDPKILSLKIVLATICDENGERELEDEDFDLLLRQPVANILPVLAKVGEVNGLTSSDVQEAVQSFGQAQSEDSSSL